MTARAPETMYSKTNRWARFGPTAKWHGLAGRLEDATGETILVAACGERFPAEDVVNMTMTKMGEAPPAILSCALCARLAAIQSRVEPVPEVEA